TFTPAKTVRCTATIGRTATGRRTPATDGNPPINRSQVFNSRNERARSGNNVRKTSAARWEEEGCVWAEAVGDEPRRKETGPSFPSPFLARAVQKLRAPTARSYRTERRVWRNIVVHINIAHASFHAAHFIPVVGCVILLPPRKVAVEA